MLVASLSGQHGALRLRIWRSLKALGAAALRDGVYVVPALPQLRAPIEDQKAEVVESGGSAYVLELCNVSAGDEAAFISLFDRTGEYAELRRSVDDFVQALSDRTEVDGRRLLRQMKRDFAAIDATDFFPAAPRADAAGALRDAERAFTRVFSPEEPAAIHATIPRRQKDAFRGSTWATRERLWVDRVASAWLIRRFIDSAARFLWLRRPADCPPSAVGFDFDGAEFTHVEDLVTFEVLVRSFDLEGDAALNRIGALVHHLDLGGDRVPEASGFEAVLSGARERCNDDDALLDDLSRVLDDLYLAFSQPRAARVPAEV